ncbi:apoptosis-inducing factor homolog [Talaromyces pinophilus]|uniref:Apoptosis-inducing factor homolog n=1 Tax=Talaromyces pinophilus TaxID=128442 RepID=A0A0B8N2R6_TALPI|nr:apoptosis-inducing factor homolog [Talaromyces pinophilus]
MATEYKLKDISSLQDIPNYEKVESEVEGVPDGKVLVVRLEDDKFHAISPRCTHYGAPLKLGVVAPDGRITCPWHGACFTVATGEIEDAPAPNRLNTFEVYEKEGAVYIKGEEGAIKAGQRDPNLKCSASTEEKVVVIGGGSGSLGTVQTLRELNFKGSITLLTKEPNLPLDRTKLSKALIADASKIEIRPAEWYSNAGIDVVHDEVTAVDFQGKSVSTKSGKSFPYTKLVLSTGGVPRDLPLEGFKDLGNIFKLRFVTDVQNILSALGEEKKKVVIIGSSFIGMEIGNALSKNHDVSIVGMEKAPLERVMGEKVGKIFQGLLEKSGVKFYLNAGVDKATPSSSNANKVGAIHLKDGTTLPADVVILGIGVKPATDFLANNSAISLLQDGSIRTDETFAIPALNGDVYAIGDIATYTYHGPGAAPETGSPVRIEHWNVAQNAGRAVARSIINKPSSPRKQHKAFIPVFWSALGQQLRYCGNTMASNGFDDLIIKGEPENAKFAAYYAKGDTIVAVATMGMDPIMVKAAELMRRGNMPKKQEIEAGVDLLKVDVPGRVVI